MNIKHNNHRSERCILVLASRMALIAALIACVPTPSEAIVKTWDGGGAQSRWSVANNWLDNVNIANGDSVVYDANSIARLTHTLNANYSVLSITLTSPLGAVTISAGNTLTISTAAGINMTGANQNLTLNCPVIMGAAQTWDVANGRTLTVGGTVNKGGFLLTIQGDGNTTISGIISTAGGLTKGGTGTLTFGGVNTYTGTTTVNNGTLTINGTTRIANTSPLTVGGGTFDLQTFAETVAAVTMTSGSIIGTGMLTGAGYTVESGTISAPLGPLAPNTLTKNTTGTVILNAAANSTYTGAVTINAGVLNIRQAQSLGTTAGGVTVVSGAALEIQGGITVGAEALNPLTGTGVSSGGALRSISGNNTYQGAITLGAGGARINSDTAGNTLTVRSITTAATRDLTVGGSGNITHNTTAISGGGNLIKDGTGTLTLSLANTFTGTTTINGGTISQGANNALGTSTAAFSITPTTGIGLYSMSGAFTQTLGLLTLGGASTTTANITTGTGTITLGGNVTYDATSNQSGATISGNLNVGTTQKTFTIGNSTAAAEDLTVSAVIANGVGGSILKTGAGTLLLSGASVAYTGGIALNQGPIVATVAGALGANTSTVTFGGGSLELRAAATTYTALLNMGASDGTITINPVAPGAGVTHTIGTLSIGTRQLSLASGTLTTTDSAYGLICGATTLSANGAVFDVANNGTGTGTLTLGAVGGNFSFTKQGAGQLTLKTASTRNAVAGTTALSAGTLRLELANALNTVAATLTLNGGKLSLGNNAGTVFNPNVTVGGTPVTVEVDRTSAGVGVTHTLGTLSIGAHQFNVIDGSFVSADTAYGLTCGNTTLSGDPTFNVANNGAGVGTLTLGALADGGTSRTITKSGVGTLTLATPANTLNADNQINISAGTLNANNATALGARAAVDVADGATFGVGASQTIGALSNVGATLNSGSVSINGAFTLTVGNVANNLSSSFSGVISGATGALTKDGTGTLTLGSATNSYAGVTTINAGILSVGTLANGGLNSSIGASTAAAANLVLGGGTLQYTGGTIGIDRAFTLTAGTTSTIEITQSSTALTISGQIAISTGALTKTGAGTLTLGNAANQYSGATTINAGILSVGTLANGGLNSSIGASTAAAANLVLGGGTLQYTGGTIAINRAFTLSNGTTSTIEVTAVGTTLTISSDSATTTGALAKTGDGTLTLSGINTYSGNTIISNGTLLVNGSLNGAGQVSAINSGTLGGTGTVAGAVCIYAGGTLAPGSNSVGILTVTNGVTFTGGTFSVNITTTNSGGYGQVKVTGGNVIITNATLSANGSGYTPVTNDYLWIVNNTGAGTVSGTFNGLVEGGTTTIAGRLFAIYYNADFATGGTSGGNDVLLKCLPPPACQTQPATLVEYTTATLNGLVTQDSGVACQYRFEYGTTTNYSTNTAWSGSVVSGETFSASLSGLQSGTVYNCRAQVTNSAGLASGSNMTFYTKPHFVGWKSPDGSSDPASGWTTDERAYDTNTGTYASDVSVATGWGAPLWLTLNQTIKSDRVRVFSDFGPPSVDMVRLEIRLQPSGVWSNVFEGSVANGASCEIPYAATNIDAARYSFHYTSDSTYWLYEFEFYVLPDVINVPTCETQPATSIEETTAILHGVVTDDGGVPCQYRFQYGLTEAYTTNTPWLGSLVNGENFTRMLTGLASNTTYHYRAQVQNSTGIGSGSDTNFTTAPPGTGWVSPTDFSDPAMKWTNAINVFDDNLDVVAKSYHNIGEPVWSTNLVLIHSSMQCDAIRFMALDSVEIDMAAVDVYLNGVWTNVFSGAFPDRVWQEVWFPKGTTTQARIRFRLIGTGYGMNWELNEFDFHRVNDVTIKGTYDGAHPVTLAVDGVVKGTFNNFTTNVFTFNPSLGAGARILLYYDDDNIPTNSGALVTRATGDDMTNLNLSVNTLILRGDYDGQLANADLVLATTGDADVPYSVASSDISVTNNISTWIQAGCTFIPGANTLTLRNNLIVDGAIDSAAGTVVFAGATVVSGATSATFNNVTISGSLTAPSSTMTVAGNWLNNGVFSNNNGQVVFNGASAISGSSTSSFGHVTILGTLTAPPGTMNVAGNWTNNGTFVHNGGTVVFNGTGTVSGAASTFNHLTIAAGASLTAPPGILTVEGNWNRVAGSTFADNGGTVVFAGAGVSTNFGSTIFNNLQCATPGKLWTFQAGTTQTVQGVLTLAGSSGNMIQLRSSVPTSKWNIAVPSGAQTVTYVDVMDSDALNNTISVSGGTNSGNNNINWVFLQTRYWVGGTGDWTNSSHWSATPGGGGGASVPGNNTPATFDAASGAGTCTLTEPVNVKGILMDTGNGMTLAQGTNAMTLGASAWEQRAGTFTGGNGPLTLDGSFQLLGGAFTAPSSSLSVKTSFTHSGGTFTHNGGTVVLVGNMTMTVPSAPLFRNVTIVSNGVFQAPSLLRLEGSLTNDGVFTANGGEIRFEGAGLVSGASTTEFANVSITANGSLMGHPTEMRLTGAWANNGVFNASSGTVVFAGNTTVSGTSTSTFNHVQITGTLNPPGDGVIGVTGNWTNNGTFNANNGTVVFSGTTGLGGVNATYFKNVLVSGTLALPAGSVYIAASLTNNGALDAGSGTVVFNGATVIGGVSTTALNNVTIDGTLTAPTNDFRVAGNWGNSGTFTHNSGTVVFSGNTTISGLSVSSFNNVTVLGSLTGPASGMINVAGNWNGSYGTFTHNSGTVVLNGTAGQIITSGGAWDAATTNNNWKNNWNNLTVNNASVGGVSFADGFKAASFICTTPNATLAFKYQETVTNVFEITGAGGLNIQGASGQLIKLQRYGGSDAATNRWEIVPYGGGWTVSYVDVSYSVNSYSNNAIFPTASTNSGYNINWFIATLVQITELYAAGYDDHVVVNWRTASEMNNAGFNVYRSATESGSYTKLNTDLIPGLGNSIKGQTYSFTDNSATSGYYKVEEVEFDGKETMHGPVQVQPAPVFEEGGGGSRVYAGALPRNPGISGIYKIYVRDEGIYRLTASNLTAMTGTTNAGNCVVGNIRLYNQGSEIPLFVHDEGDAKFGVNDYIEFYGTGLNTRFSYDNVYWFYEAATSGLRIAGAGWSGGSPATNISDTFHYEQDEMYWEEFPDVTPDDDHWFFFGPMVAPATNDFKFVMPDVSSLPGAITVRIAFRGVNYSVDHHARVKLNGTALVDGYWSGDSEYIYTASAAQSNLISGTNTIRVTLPKDTGASIEHVLVNWIEIDYTRDLKAVSNMIAFPVTGTGVSSYAVSGFSSSTAEVYGVVSGTNVVIVTNSVVGGTGPYTVAFSIDRTVFPRLVAAGAGALKTPGSIIEDTESSLRSVTNGADYIIIAPGAFHSALQSLVTYRSGQGLRVKVVDVEDVYDEFNYGIFSPYAIRDFLAYARENWVLPVPQYVLLVGDATYDYKDIDGYGPSIVPVKMVHDADDWEAPSDNWYVTLDGGDDFVPDMYIGRFPAQTANEVTVMVNKTIAYESASAEDLWARKVVLIADTGDHYFESMCNDADEYIPDNYNVSKIYRRSYGSEGAAATAVMNSFNQGSLVTLYSGHGSVDQWREQNFFEVADIGSITNRSRLPVVITPTCLNGYFTYPGWEGLGEDLLRSSNGAIACVSPSGLSWPQHQDIIVENIFDTIFQGGVFELGKTVKHSLYMMFADIGEYSRDLVQTTIFLGDPALRLKKWSGYSPVYGPGSTDTDGDGMPDGWEINNLLNAEDDSDATDDADSDGLVNLSEYSFGGDPNNGDTDSDGMPDLWEAQNNLLLAVDDTAGDADSDGLVNIDEYMLGTNPRNADTDGDGMPDGWEINNLLNAEDNSDATDDADGDGLVNLSEYSFGGDPNNGDTDSDGMPDLWEAQNNLLLAVDDSAGDADSDGLVNIDEYMLGTNPRNADTDGDGYDDASEVTAGTSPVDPLDFPGNVIRNDFDGDQKSDLCVYYPPEGLWYFSLSSGGFLTKHFGFSGASPVAGDFDGDGGTDYGCYDANSGSWFFMNSTDGFITKQFGYAGTVPVVGDFDGDGKDDYGCYDAAGNFGQPAGSWYFMMSTDGFKTKTFGYAGTVPVVGDFDGDGKDDYGCYDAAGNFGQPSGSWYLMQSARGFQTATFGYAGTVPVVGDFDGDRKDDYGCYDAAGNFGQPAGSWYLMQSARGFQTATFGYAGTVPVVGDFDRDGKNDYGCYDAAGNFGQPAGSWYLMQSTDGFKTEIFGYAGTIPPGSFRSGE